MKKLLVSLISLCIGIFLYAYMFDQPVDIALRSAYFAVFGGVFVWFQGRGK